MQNLKEDLFKYNVRARTIVESFRSKHLGDRKVDRKIYFHYHGLFLLQALCYNVK